MPIIRQASDSSCWVGARRAPTRPSEAQIPHRDPVTRPVQQPCRKQPCRPMVMPKNSPGAVTSRNVPSGRPARTTAGIRTATAPAMNPWMHSPSVGSPLTFPRFRATNQILAPAAPATLAASETTSTGPTDRCARPASTACTASATMTPTATSGTHDAAIRPGPVANPAARVVTRVPALPAGTGFPFGHRNLRRLSGPVGGGAGSARTCWP